MELALELLELLPAVDWEWAAGWWLARTRPALRRRAAAHEGRVPFHRATVVGAEREFVVQALEGRHHAGDGAFTRRCRALLERELNARRVLSRNKPAKRRLGPPSRGRVSRRYRGAAPPLCGLLTTSGTHAREMAALLLNIREGDEVIVPSFTFVSTANAFVLRGAKPVFADVREDTLNPDERQIGDLITPRTKAVAPVHYGGVGCEMETILRVAGQHGIAIVEDNAHGLFGRYQGRPLGSFGCLAAQSFHESKNVSCGEGGALVVNEPALAERAEVIREKGTNRTRFLNGLTDKYTWLDVGSSYLLSGILAACLLAQLEARDTIQAGRRWAWHYYAENLEDWAAARGVGMQRVPQDCEPAYHLFYLILPSAEIRQQLADRLRRQGIGSATHYPPLHLSPMGLRFGGRKGQCPVTEGASARLLRLPLFFGLTRSEQERIVETVLGMDW